MPQPSSQTSGGASLPWGQSVCSPSRSVCSQNLKAGELPQPTFPDDYNLGDIILGVELISQQCEEHEDYYDVLTVSA